MKFSTIQRLVLIILLALCLFSGSADISLIRAQEVTLRVMVWSWSPQVDESLDRALEEFEESRGVNIDLIRVPLPSNYWDELLAHLYSKMPPDVLWIDYDMVTPLVEWGKIIELDPFVAARPEVIQGCPCTVPERFRYQDRLYGIPLGDEGEFALNAYAISPTAIEFTKTDVAFELITFLRTRILHLPSKLPDLVVELGFSPERPRPGDEALVTAVIRNIGNAPAEQVVVLFMVDRQEVVRKTIRHMESGGQEVVTATWKVTAPGDHTLYIEIDPEGWIRESNKENNIIGEVIAVGRGIEDLPDLVVEDISISPKASYVGDEVVIEAIIRNIGGALAEGVSVVFRGDDGWERSTIIEYIEAGGQKIAKVTRIAPSLGEYLITVIVDPKDEITESNERNNQAWQHIKENGFVEMERAEFKTLIIENPNYFDTFPGYDIAPVKPMKANTKYEELRCIGFHPEQDLLEAIIDVKLPYGYKGGLCSPGSFEYVRFFVDWNGDGDFEDADEDVGIASVNVHDIPDSKAACLDKTKPLSYAVTVKIDSKKKKCTIPNLVEVRAILSWDVPPPAGNPDYVAPWGNAIEKWIQIKPKPDGLVLGDIKDAINVADLAKLNIKLEMLDLEKPILKAKALTPVELKEIYRVEDVPEHRFNFEEISLMAEKIKQDPNLMVEYKLDPKFSKIIENVDIVLAEKSNTKYEELHCVGLNYDLDTLVATLTVKLPYGYCGDLCSKGSYEYVAFWAYVRDQIEQMCYWRYLGTSRVNVHDIKNIPLEGLQYAVKLPVDLWDFKDKCSNPKVLKVRAILSWQTPPPANNPNYDPVWGNKVDALIQIKPGEVKPGEQKPVIWSVGEMVVESIAGNAFSNPVTVGSISDGYANGPSVGGGYLALESPFGGVIKISGTITHAPDNPAEADKLRYKVQYRKSGEANWHDIGNKFRIWIRIDGVPSGHIDQIVDDDGYFKYQKDLKTPVIVEVQDDVLAQWHTPVAEGDGLYEIRVLLYQPGAVVLGCPSDHVCSSVVKVMIDNTRPKAEVSLDAGACEKFEVGDSITGRFTATDEHIDHYALTVLPPVTHPPVIAPTGEKYPTLPKPGRTNELFTLTTTKDITTPCGYVVYLGVWDRTIRNNAMVGNQNSATVGLCLLEEEE